MSGDTDRAVEAGLREALQSWWSDEPWEHGDHELDKEGDYFCYGCGAKAPFDYDRTKPNWWDQRPDPLVGHDEPCPWLLTRAALASSRPAAPADTWCREHHVYDQCPEACPRCRGYWHGHDPAE